MVEHYKLALHVFLVCLPQTSFFFFNFIFTVPFLYILFKVMCFDLQVFWNVETINTDFCFPCISLKSSCKQDFYLLCLLVVVFNFLIDGGVDYYCCCSVVKFRWLLHFCVFYRFYFCVWECSLFARKEDLQWNVYSSLFPGSMLYCYLSLFSHHQCSLTFQCIGFIYYKS